MAAVQVESPQQKVYMSLVDSCDRALPKSVSMGVKDRMNIHLGMRSRPIVQVSWHGLVC